MTIASKGTLGATGLRTSASSIVHTTTITEAEVGDTIIVIVAKDNALTSSGNSTGQITNVADSAGNTYAPFSTEHTKASGSANDGVTVAAWFSNVTAVLGVGGTITATFANASTARSITARVFTRANALELATGSPATTTSTSASPGSLTKSGLTSREYLWLRATGMEDQVSTWTPTAGHTSFTMDSSPGGGSSTSNITAGGEFIIATGTGNTSNPTVGGGSRDNASFMEGLAESTTSLSAAQSIPAFTQSATMAIAPAIAGAQTLLVFTQSATANSTIAITGAQTLAEFTQAATVNRSADAVAAQTLPVFTQLATMFLDDSSALVSGAQQLEDFSQSATAIVKASVAGGQTGEVFTQSATAEASAQAVAAQTMPVFSQAATVVVVTDAEADQTLPVFTQNATLSQPFAMVEGAQTISVFTQSATLHVINPADISNSLNSAIVPAFPETAVVPPYIESALVPVNTASATAPAQPDTAVVS